MITVNRCNFNSEIIVSANCSFICRINNFRGKLLFCFFVRFIVSRSSVVGFNAVIVCGIGVRIILNSFCSPSLIKVVVLEPVLKCAATFKILFEELLYFSENLNRGDLVDMIMLRYFSLRRIGDRYPSPDNVRRLPQTDR